ncbi:unnamed protein product [Didymodactylos carnosus]|uniref:Reverse transcriptase domain-containing protein n=1 Tax=Didymodactylos carnosus TaxID=1234261 RepID=A0A8S2HXJ4_9BILA|nr:unnamed protein product [Didymodactylos carnosus]CAF3690624.1 unnamed protein product [Didymodactylos carnosus]
MNKQDNPVRVPLRLTDSIRIPPQQQVAVRVSACISSSKVLFKPSYTLKQQIPVFMSNSLIDIQQYSASIPIYNPTNYPCYLSKGVIIGVSTVPTKQQLEVKSPSRKLSLQEHIENMVKHIEDTNQRQHLKQLVEQFQQLFDTSKITVAKTKISHMIHTVAHAPPVSRPYRTTPEKEKEMERIVMELLDAGLISRSNSQYAASALLTPKSDGTLRLVMDYKKLNHITIKDNFPLPNMEQTIQRLGEGYRYFTKLDLKSGFWQIPIREEDKIKTAFVTPFGLFQFNVLPQGLKNSPPTFERVMSTALESCRQFCQVYLDDIVIFSKSYDQHLVHMKKVFECLKENNLQLNPSKCSIVHLKIDYLGYTITEKTITPLNDKVNAILKLSEPRTLKQSNQFIDAIAWYRKFIKKFAEVAALIHAVTNLTKSSQVPMDARSLPIMSHDGKESQQQKGGKNCSASSGVQYKEIMDFAYGLEVSQDRPPVLGMVGVTTRSKSKLETSTNQQSIPVHPSTVKDAPQKFVPHFDITRLKEEQAKDQGIRNKIEEVRVNPTKHPYVFQDGILYKVATRNRGATKFKLIYLPSSMILPALRAYHDHPIAGHFSSKRTYYKMKFQYWWPDMYHSTEDYIKACLPCQQHNHNRQKRPGHLKPIPPPHGPFQVIESNNWDSFLPSVVFAYNTGQHGTTGYSPFQLQYGQKPKLPPDEPPKQVIFAKPNDYYQQFKKNLKIYHEYARRNMIRQQERSKQRYDAKRQDPHYSVGQLVLTRYCGPKSKLDEKYSKIPCRIFDCGHPVYWVKDIETQAESRVHVNDLRLVLETSQH